MSSNTFTQTIDAARRIPLPRDYQIEFNLGREIITSQAGLPHRQFTGSAYWHGSFTPVPIGRDEEEKRRRILGFLTAADRETGWFLVDVAQPRIAEAAAITWHKCDKAEKTSPPEIRGLGGVTATLKPGDVVSVVKSERLVELPVTRTVVETAADGTITLNHPLPGEMLWDDKIVWINAERPAIRAIFQNPVLNWTSENGFMQLATQGWIEDIQTVILRLAEEAKTDKELRGNSDTIFVVAGSGDRPVLGGGDGVVGSGV